MGNTLAALVVGLGVVGGAGAGAVVVTLLMPSSVGEAASAPALGPSLSAELVARIDALEDKNSALRARLVELELTPAPAARQPVAEGESDYVTRAELDALRDELTVARAANDSTSLESPELKEHVAAALSTIRKDERVKKVDDYQTKRTARIDDDIEWLEEKLELSPYQSREMRTALLDQYEREAEVARLWKDGAEDEVLGSMKEESVTTFKADIELVLSPEQVESFWTEVSRRGK